MRGRSAGRQAGGPSAKADHEAGVLIPRIPIAERAGPRKIAMGGDTV